MAPRRRDRPRCRPRRAAPRSRRCRNRRRAARRRALPLRRDPSSAPTSRTHPARYGGRVPQKVILDVDTGTDDAVAIMFAALHPELELVAVTTVNGNVPAENTTDNTLRVLDFIGRSDVPVYRGLSRPLVRHDFPGRKDYGSGSKEGQARKELPTPPPTSRAQETGAVEFLVETFRSATEPIALVPVGLLSNPGRAVALAPRRCARARSLIGENGARGRDHGRRAPRREHDAVCGIQYLGGSRGGG